MLDEKNYNANIWDQYEKLQGYGRSYGLEFLSKYTGIKNGITLSYTLSKTTRRYSELNRGKEFPYTFDRRHQFKIFAYQKITDRLQLGINWMYLTPSPKINLLTDSDEDPLTKLDDDDGNRNSERVNPYHRLDISFSYKYSTSKFEHTFKLGAYNTYNRKNIAYYQMNINDLEDDSYVPVYSIPFIPSISYSLAF